MVVAEELGRPVPVRLDDEQSVQITLLDAPAAAVGWTRDQPAQDDAIPT